MRYNLDNGAIKAKALFESLDRLIRHHSSQRGSHPRHIAMFDKDYQSLRDKVEKKIEKSGQIPSSDLQLFYKGVLITTQQQASGMASAQ